MEDAGIKPNFEMDIHDEGEDDDEELLQSAESLSQQQDDSLVKSILEESGIESSMLIDMVKNNGYSSASFASYTEENKDTKATNESNVKVDVQGFKDDSTSLMESATELSQQIHSTTQDETSNKVEIISQGLFETYHLDGKNAVTHTTEKLLTTLEASSRYSDEPTEQHPITINETANSFDISSIVIDVNQIVKEPLNIHNEHSFAQIAPIVDDIVSAAVSQIKVKPQSKDTSLSHETKEDPTFNIHSKAEERLTETTLEGYFHFLFLES